VPDMDPIVAALRAECGLDDDEVERRKAFLELTPADVAILREIHEPLLRRRPQFTLAFYDHLREVPELRRWLGDEDTLTRLRASQTRYFEQLTAGDYGEDYVHSRLRVGAVHQQIGLAPKWYLGAYRKYLGELIAPLWQVCEGDFERFRRAYDALLKVVVLDMELALETYFAADSRRIRELKAYAEQIIQCMPSGLAVLGEDRRFRFLNPAFRRLFDLQADEMPESLDALLPVEAVRERVIGLLIDAQRLYEIRERRRPGSDYASLAQCRRELRALRDLYDRYGIQYIDSTRLSVEELAAGIVHRLRPSTLSR